MIGILTLHSQVSSLDDIKTNQTDNNAAKTIALDHLGVIAARIRSSALKVHAQGSDTGPKSRLLKPLDEVPTKFVSTESSL